MTKPSPRIRDRKVDERVVKQIAERFTSVGGFTGNVEDSVRELLAKRVINPKTIWRVVPETQIHNGYRAQVGDLIATGMSKIDGTGEGTVLEVISVVKRLKVDTSQYSRYGGDELEVLNLSTGKVSLIFHRSWCKKVELL